VTSVLVPVAFNAIYLTGLVQSLFDITPLGFAVSIFLTLLATVKYQFIDLRRELAITSEKLLLEQERNRIAQQVHDTTGHTLTMIQSYMKLAEMSVKNEEPDKTKEYLADARTLTSQGIRELRESINQLRKEASYELLTQGIMQLAAQVKEIPVEVTIRGEDSERYSHLSRVLYDTTREAITNSLKYAESTKIEIVVRFQGKSVELVIGDDGKGCEVIRENNGIRGIRERVEQAGGTVRFLSSAGEGFLIRVKIPV
jgi:signal transduction histidine kinase